MTQPQEPISTPAAAPAAAPSPARGGRLWRLLLPALLLPLWFALGYAGFELAWRLHLAWHPEHAGHSLDYWRQGVDAARFLMLVPPMVAALPLSMLIANALAYALPAARRALAHGAGDAAAAHYAASQRALQGFTAAVIAASAAAAVLGAWMG